MLRSERRRFDADDGDAGGRSDVDAALINERRRRCVRLMRLLVSGHVNVRLQLLLLVNCCSGGVYGHLVELLLKAHHTAMDKTGGKKTIRTRFKINTLS